MHLKCGIIHHTACSFFLNFAIQVVQNRATTERGQKGELPWASHFRGTTIISSNCKKTLKGFVQQLLSVKVSKFRHLKLLLNNKIVFKKAHNPKNYASCGKIHHDTFPCKFSHAQAAQKPYSSNHCSGHKLMHHNVNVCKSDMIHYDTFPFKFSHAQAIQKL